MVTAAATAGGTRGSAAALLLLLLKLQLLPARAVLKHSADICEIDESSFSFFSSALSSKKEKGRSRESESENEFITIFHRSLRDFASTLTSIVATIASRLLLFSRAHALSVSRARLMPGPAVAEMTGIGGAAAGAGGTGATTTGPAANVGSIASSLPHRRASASTSAPAASASTSTPRGAFIVLEGVDRCGKTTQCARLVERLRASGVRDCFFFPSSFFERAFVVPTSSSFVLASSPSPSNRSKPRCGASRTAPPRSAP